MRSIVAASLVGVSAATMQCPGSPAFLTHAGIELTTTAAASCAVVKAEIKARIAGTNGWYDQHNRGTYTEQNYGGDVSASRLTGDGKYTDKMIYTLSAAGSDCKIEVCSESQVTSVADFGTNYCETKLLFCGKDEGCLFAISNFTSSGESFKTKAGASTGMGNCLKVLEEEKLEAHSEGYNCPGSGSLIHAWMEVTATASASCSTVQAEIEARATGNWVDPHNGGIYSVLSSSSNLIQTQRTTNPATSVGGQLYTDKQTFELSASGSGCQIKACSESQGTSVGDFSTNYCDIRNLYCGPSDDCISAGHDFAHAENSHTGSIGSGHDSSACIVATGVSV